MSAARLHVGLPLLHRIEHKRCWRTYRESPSSPCSPRGQIAKSATEGREAFQEEGTIINRSRPLPGADGHWKTEIGVEMISMFLTNRTVLMRRETELS